MQTDWTDDQRHEFYGRMCRFMADNMAAFLPPGVRIDQNVWGLISHNAAFVAAMLIKAHLEGAEIELIDAETEETVAVESRGLH